jgi:hypothetical protein
MTTRSCTLVHQIPQGTRESDRTYECVRWQGQPMDHLAEENFRPQYRSIAGDREESRSDIGSGRLQGVRHRYYLVRAEICPKEIPLLVGSVHILIFRKRNQILIYHFGRNEYLRWDKTNIDLYSLSSWEIKIKKRMVYLFFSLY